jgi:surface-anchored protein
MKTPSAGLGLLFLSSLTGQALESLPEHVDITPVYTNGEWTWTIVSDGDVKETNEVFLPARDLETPGGELFQRPPGEQWDFLGMEAGEPVWILPQSDAGYTWPGIENAQSGTFSSYVESDPRAGGLAQPWVRIGLEGVEGPGAFSLFQIQGGAPTVWMSSADGISVEDVFLLASPGHDHMNWTFSEKGVYRVSLNASAFLGSGATNPTAPGEAVDLFFSVGARAAWRASSFAADEVMNELLAGDAADADQDGIENFLEYAFGTAPRSASPLNVELGETAGPELMMVSDGGVGYPALRFFKRNSSDADVSYEVEWSGGLTGAWEEGGIEHQVEDFGDGWERVTIRDDQAVSGSRFGRVRVIATE